MCLIGKMQLLGMQCRGIGPHLVAWGKSHGFSRVAAGSRAVLELRRGCTFLMGVCLVKSAHLSRYDGHLGKLT